MSKLDKDILKYQKYTTEEVKKGSNLNVLSYTHPFKLAISKERFLLAAKPLVEDIDEVICNELYMCCAGIINGDLPPQYSWERFFFKALYEQGKIELTELGKMLYHEPHWDHDREMTRMSDRVSKQ